MHDGTVRPVVAVVAGIDDYHVQVLAGIAKTLDAQTIPLLVVTINGSTAKSLPQIVVDLLDRRVPRGVIALMDGALSCRTDLAPLLAAADLPVVTLVGKLGDAPRIRGDNVTGMRALLGHLLDTCGVRRPVLVRGVPGLVDSEIRESIFREECAHRGVAVDEDLVVDGWFRAKTTFDRMRDLLLRRQDFDAVVALNDLSAFGCLSALADHGLRVPEDVLVSGFDNVHDSAVTWPPLTTVDQHLEEQGCRAAELLLSLLDGRPCPQDDQVPSQLVVRTSTAQGALDTHPVMAPARALQARVTLQEFAVQISWTMAKCRSVADVVAALDPCLAQLGIDRCFLCLTQPPGAEDPKAPHPTTLAFSYRDGHAEDIAEDVFPHHELLPPSLRHELDRGGLLLLPLSANGRERGYLLYDTNTTSHGLTEILRMDVPRIVEMVCGSQELKKRAAGLERLVTQRTRELARANAELQRSAMRDGLTGIANRRAFETFLHETCHANPRAEPHQTDPSHDHPQQPGPNPADAPSRSIALLMIDVDTFKTYNDHYGHIAGDDALRTIATCLDRSLRGAHDLACRYGGEEFAVILPNADLTCALAIAHRFADLLATAAIPHEASPIAPMVTVSIGVTATTLTPHLTPADLIAAADHALYQAKSQGRNRIVTAADAGTQTCRQAR